jgi:hypothetical protein
MQPKRNPLPADEDARDDWGILVLLIGETDQRPWSVDELIRERGDELAARDSISRLERAGLIHRTTRISSPDEIRAALHEDQGIGAIGQAFARALGLVDRYTVYSSANRTTVAAHAAAASPADAVPSK